MLCVALLLALVPLVHPLEFVPLVHPSTFSNQLKLKHSAEGSTGYRCFVNIGRQLQNEMVTERSLKWLEHQLVRKLNNCQKEFNGKSNHMFDNQQLKNHNRFKRIPLPGVPPPVAQIINGLPSPSIVPKGIPGTSNVPNGIPGTNNVLSGLPGTNNVPNGLPGTNNVPNGLPGTNNIPNGVSGTNNVPNPVRGTHGTSNGASTGNSAGQIGNPGKNDFNKWQNAGNRENSNNQLSENGRQGNDQGNNGLNNQGMWANFDFQTWLDEGRPYIKTMNRRKRYVATPIVEDVPAVAKYEAQKPTDQHARGMILGNDLYYNQQEMECERRTREYACKELEMELENANCEICKLVEHIRNQVQFKKCVCDGQDGGGFSTANAQNCTTKAVAAEVKKQYPKLFQSEEYFSHCI